MSTFDRNSMMVYISYAFQAMGLAISWQFVTYFVRNDLGVEDFITLTIVWAAPNLITMVIVNLWGSLSDRMQKRKPFMIIGFLGYSGTFMSYSFVQNSLQYLTIAIIGSIFFSAALPMAQSHLTTQTTKKGARLGFLLVFQSAGWFFGALFSGWFYQSLTMFVLYRIAAILCLTAAIFCILFVKEIPFDIDEESEATTFGELIRRPGMLKLTGAVASSQLGINAIAFLMAIMIIDELNGLPIYVGLANSGATLLAVIITGFIGVIIDRRGPIKVLITAYASYAIFAVAFALVKDPIIASLMWALPIYPLAATASSTMAALLSNEEERGRAMSLISGAQNAGAAIGPIVGGIAAEFIFHRVQPLSWINYLFNVIALILIGGLLYQTNHQISDGSYKKHGELQEGRL